MQGSILPVARHCTPCGTHLFYAEVVGKVWFRCCACLHFKSQHRHGLVIAAIFQLPCPSHIVACCPSMVRGQTCFRHAAPDTCTQPKERIHVTPNLHPTSKLKSRGKKKIQEQHTATHKQPRHSFADGAVDGLGVVHLSGLDRICSLSSHEDKQSCIKSLAMGLNVLHFFF